VLELGEHYGDWDYGQGRKVVIDMSSPNIAKPMSMGHLRSTVIGNAIANLEKKVGYEPIRINHLGDWGTQFGKLIVAYKKWGTKEAVEQDPIAELLRLYVKFHDEAERDSSLEDEGRAWFKKLEDGDAEAEELWNWFKSESLKEFNRVYDILGITFDSYNGEAFYNDKMDPIVEYLENNGITTIDRGATVVHLDKYDLPPALIKKSDGATLYITRDLAAAHYRKATYDFNQCNPHHNLDLFNHIISVVSKVPADLELRYTALLHDIAKPLVQTFDEKGVCFHFKNLRCSAGNSGIVCCFGAFATFNKSSC